MNSFRNIIDKKTQKNRMGHGKSNGFKIYDIVASKFRKKPKTIKCRKCEEFFLMSFINSFENK